MNIKLTIPLYLLFAFLGASYAFAGDKVTEQKEAKLDPQSAKTLEVAQAFLWAAGSGDGGKLKSLMADDFVWHNEGNNSIPWIGIWKGKETVLNKFMPKFSAGLKTTSWTTDYSFANGDQAVFIGSMSAIANNSGVDTGKFSWAVRVHVEEGKVKSWNWFEDSYAVSKAYHAKK
jgi:ketosteroid isomerase-like protein